MKCVLALRERSNGSHADCDAMQKRVLGVFQLQELPKSLNICQFLVLGGVIWMGDQGHLCFSVKSQEDTEKKWPSSGANSDLLLVTDLPSEIQSCLNERFGCIEVP